MVVGRLPRTWSDGVGIGPQNLRTRADRPKNGGGTKPRKISTRKPEPERKGHTVPPLSTALVKLTGRLPEGWADRPKAPRFTPGQDAAGRGRVRPLGDA